MTNKTLFPDLEYSKMVAPIAACELIKLLDDNKLLGEKRG